MAEAVSRMCLCFPTRFGVLSLSMAPGEMEKLMAHDWPGNVRELQNVPEEALACCVADHLGFNNLRAPLRAVPSPLATGPGPSATLCSYENAQRDYFEQALQQSGGRIAGPCSAARMTGLNVSTFWYKREKLGLELRKTHKT